MRFSEATPNMFDDVPVDDDSDKWRICPNCHAEIKKDMRDAVCSNCHKFFVSPGNNIANRPLPADSPVMSACTTCKALARIPAAETTFVCTKKKCLSKNERASELSDIVGVSPCKKCGTVAGVEKEQLLQCSECGYNGLRNPEPATVALKSNTKQLIAKRFGKKDEPEEPVELTAEEEPIELTLAKPELPVAKLILPVAKPIKGFGTLGFDEAGMTSARQAYNLPLSKTIERALKRSGVSNLPNYDELLSGHVDIPPVVIALAFRNQDDKFVSPAKVRARLMGMLAESGKRSVNDPFALVDAIEGLKKYFPELNLPSANEMDNFLISNPPLDIVQPIMSGNAFMGGILSPRVGKSIQQWLNKVPNNKIGDAVRSLKGLTATLDKNSAIALNDFFSDFFHR